MTRNLRIQAFSLIGALALILAACSSSDDAGEDTAELSSTSVAAADVQTDTEGGASPATFDPDATLLTAEFEPLEIGAYRVDTLGTPFSFEVADASFVQPNSGAMFVVTHPSSQRPDDRDVVFLRVSDLSDPTQPGSEIEEQEVWPTNDIEGWLDAVIDDVVISNRTETTVGGRSAVQFDVQLSDDPQCAEEFCVGFVTNRFVNSKVFRRRSLYRIWWVDQDDESPIAIIAAVLNDFQSEWFDTADSIVGSVAFGDTLPNPIPAEGDLWTLGFPSEVPAGLVEVPILGGLRFELPNDEFIFQSVSEGLLFVALGDEPADSEFQFIVSNEAGDPIATAQDAIDQLIEAGAEVTEVESATVAGFPTRVVDLTGGSSREPIFNRVDQDPGGWRLPNAARLWFIESDRGLLLATAEAFETSAPLEDVIAQTTAILSTLEFIDL